MELGDIKNLDKLKIELSVNPRNPHTISGLGGNAGEFLFLLENQVVSEEVPSIEEAGFVKENNSIVAKFVTGSDESNKEKHFKFMRSSLTEFIKSKYPIFAEFHKDFSFDQLITKVMSAPSMGETTLLQEAILIASDLKKSLDAKNELCKQLDIVFNNEKEVFIAEFCRAVNCPIETFYSERGLWNKKFEAHMSGDSVLGPKYHGMQKRHEQIWNLILSEDDLEKLQELENYPPHIKIFTARTIIGIDTVVRFNLDERAEISIPL